MINISSNEISKTLEIHLASMPPKSIATALNIDESNVSRLKSCERKLNFHEFTMIIAIPSPQFPNGLKICDFNDMVVTQEELKALKTLSKKALNTLDAGKE